MEPISEELDVAKINVEGSAQQVSAEADVADQPKADVADQPKADVADQPKADVADQPEADVAAEIKPVAEIQPSSKPELEATVDALNDALYNQLIKIMHGEKLNLTNIISVTRKLIELVNKVKAHGIEKKALVTAVLKRFVETHMKGEPDLQLVLNYIFDLLPFVIDEIAGVVNRKKSKWCFGC